MALKSIGAELPMLSEHIHTHGGISQTSVLLFQTHMVSAHCAPIHLGSIVHG